MKSPKVRAVIDVVRRNRVSRPMSGQVEHIGLSHRYRLHRCRRIAKRRRRRLSGCCAVSVLRNRSADNADDCPCFGISVSTQGRVDPFDQKVRA